MSYAAIPEPAGFLALGKREQILYVQALWDRIADPSDQIPVLDSHLELAEERLRAYRQDPGRAQCAQEMLHQVAQHEL